ncbi:16315_t:CDS:1, partial [Cetraspora pellucida]
TLITSVILVTSATLLGKLLVVNKQVLLLLTDDSFNFCAKSL